MVNYKSGEVSWTDPVLDSSKKQTSQDFLRLNPGSNIVRLLTMPHQFQQHKYLPEGGKKFGYRVNCSGETGSCPLCEQGNRPKHRWFIGVIDRKSNSYKILDIGYTVFKDIQTLAKDDDWGDPGRYDIDIVVDQQGGATGYYTVVAKPPKPLTASDLVHKEEHTSEELDKRTAPPTADKVKERLTKIHEQIAHDSGISSNLMNANSDSDEEIIDFKNYDAKSSTKSA